MVFKVLLVAAIIFVLLFTGYAFGSDIEYDASKDSIVFRNPAAQRLLDTVQDAELRAAIIANMAQEIQRREDERKLISAEVAEKNAVISSQSTAIAKADFIMDNFTKMRTEWSALLEAQQKTCSLQNSMYQELLRSCMDQVKDAKKEAFWSKAASIASFILAIFTFGIMH